MVIIELLEKEKRVGGLPRMLVLRKLYDTKFYDLNKKAVENSTTGPRF